MLTIVIAVVAFALGVAAALVAVYFHLKQKLVKAISDEVEAIHAEAVGDLRLWRALVKSETQKFIDEVKAKL